ncbi:MAG: DNA recombination protein RmuC [Acidobacteria bacterium]|nr:DNA recombination protein RmuC [Acidobacteriota bacterium]NIM60227.1 DNA recombination protein RmuC [Acidobacteriota bacterium]NIO60265.1 DNA recombination protein RmuC [Acidobacteriota bacterium]NIQ31320.1 DNA recombination protein RmuC [Acidobacteriota bacterium]NIQ86543.1 DNA recombination protein RmuC [Acidobacteriota bacterium]
MTTALIVLTVFLAAAVLVVYRLLSRMSLRIQELQKDDPAPALVVMQQQLDGLREQVRVSLESGRTEIDRRLVETQRVVGDVRRSLGEVTGQVKAVHRATRDLQGLQEMLRAPNVRGGVGEYLLAELLAQVLPQAHFDLQYAFKGGERVDAILRLGEGIVPVDSKFPLENFRRLRRAAEDGDESAERAANRAFVGDVKRHIDAIAERYIRPGEGTYEFAMMYIPAEGVYQEVIRQREGDGLDVFQYALARRVVPVSPQSFYAYLQVIVMGLRGLTIERRAREIMERVGDAQLKLDRFGESFDLVGKHLGHAQRQYDEAARRLERTDAAIEQLHAGDATQEPVRPLRRAEAFGEDH